MATVRIRPGHAADAPLLHEHQGFQRSGRFDVGGWIGQVFTMRL